MLGTIGHLLILTAFVACLVSAGAFFWATRREDLHSAWQPIGRGAWGAMLLAALAASGVLLYLLVTHQFQYAYVYENTSRALPLHYLISAFWAGQTGSFLLWILLTGVVGVVLIRTAKDYEAPVLAVMALCQAFLLSMLLGLDLGGLSIGVSPFESLAEAFPQAPIFQQNPNFIPTDGQGLNDLLQNPWMTIHPPTLFTGFALMTVPFAFAVAALWKKKYTQWVRPAMPWTIAAVGVLGFGIALGAYWAYVTLNFGGYWAWDPVENTPLVAWLVGIAALHTMLVQRKSARSHRATFVLSIAAFMLVVYSTFLTRSGILGDSSVHSFVDLGLYNQLLLWILTMAALGFGLLAWRYRELPVSRKEPRFLSREFMIFSGAMLLCATAAVITVGTSSPILGEIFRENPSGVPMSFYNEWTLPLALGIVFLAGLGQLLWWNKMSVEHLNRALIKPLGLAVASTVALLLFTPFVERTVQPVAAEASQRVAEASLLGAFGPFWESYGQGLLLLLLVFGGFFAFYGNAMVLWRIGRGKPKMAGGALAHVGFALVILGVVASSGFSNPLAGTNDPDRQNFVLTRGETRLVEGYRVTYVRREETKRGRGRYVLRFAAPNGRTFMLKPVAYANDSGQWFMHPDVQMFFEKDIYAAVTPRAATGISQSEEVNTLTLAQGDSTVIGNEQYAFSFKRFETRVDRQLLPDSTDIAVAAVLDVTNLKTGETRRLRPVYLIMQDRSQQYLQNRVTDWGLTVTFVGMNVDSGEARFAVKGAQVMPDDWIVVQAYEKPFIGILWAGILLLTGGFGLALVRRTRDVRLWRRRERKA